MDNDSPHMKETRRLRVVAAQTRLQAVETQLALAFSYCAIAETELNYQHVDRVQNLIQEVRHIADTVQQHVAEPDHVPPGNVDKLYDELTRLDSRVRVIETQLKATG